MSNPPGATVSLDGKEIGRTPFSTNFDHYGKREFRVVKQGYETKTVLMPVSTPWFQWPGVDFVTEVLLPGKLTDHKYYEFDLQPSAAVSGAEIVARAEEYRQTAHADGVLRVGSSAVSAPPGNVGSIIPPASNSIPVPASNPAPNFAPSFAPIIPAQPNAL
ncbi:MAG: PEGA domain-containing protein [Planctomycetaceae bacterium]|nr:PEGA domain-containing protein [Planctomycetaceae bacterium]